MPSTIKLMILIMWGILLWPISAYCIALIANLLQIGYFALFEPETYQVVMSCEDNCGWLFIAWFLVGLVLAPIVVAVYFKTVINWYKKRQPND
jgi:hypothetical protein